METGKESKNKEEKGNSIMLYLSVSNYNSSYEVKVIRSFGNTILDVVVKEYLELKVEK